MWLSSLGYHCKGLERAPQCVREAQYIILHNDNELQFSGSYAIYCAVPFTVSFRVNCKPMCCAPPSPASSSSYLPHLLIASFSLVLIQSPTSCLLWSVISVSDGLSKWPHQMTDLKMKLKVIKDYRGGKAEAVTLQPCPIYHSSHLEEQKQNKGDH